MPTVTLVLLAAPVFLSSVTCADPPVAPRTLVAGDGPAHVAFAPDGKTLAVGSGKKLRLLDPSTGKGLRDLPGHDWPVHGVTFSRDGKTLASVAGGFREGKRGGEVKLWDVATGKVRHELRWWEGADVNAVAFSPDNAHVAAGGSKGVRVWDAASGKLLKQLPMDAAVLALAYSPDSKTLVAGAFTQTVHLWDTGTWKEATLKGHSSEVRAVAYSLDGKLLVSGGVGEARVWDVKTGKHLRSLKHKGTVWVASFGLRRTLATGSGDPVADGEGGARVWNLADWSTKGEWTGKGGAVVSVAFSPGGKALAEGRYNGVVVVRPLVGAER